MFIRKYPRYLNMLETQSYYLVIKLSLYEFDSQKILCLQKHSKSLCNKFLVSYVPKIWLSPKFAEYVFEKEWSFVLLECNIIWVRRITDEYEDVHTITTKWKFLKLKMLKIWKLCLWVISCDRCFSIHSCDFMKI